MGPHISFDTAEFSRSQAHTLVDAAYAGQREVTDTDEPSFTETERAQARELVGLSAAPGWRALVDALARDGRAEVGQVAARIGRTPQGVLVAIGRAVQGRYGAYDWTWEGRGDGQVVAVGKGMQAALVAQRDSILEGETDDDE